MNYYYKFDIKEVIRHELKDITISFKNNEYVEYNTYKESSELLADLIFADFLEFDGTQIEVNEKIINHNNIKNAIVNIQSDWVCVKLWCNVNKSERYIRYIDENELEIEIHNHINS